MASQIIEKMKDEIKNGSSKERAALKKLLSMNFSEDESCFILLGLKKEAENKSDDPANALPAYTRSLKKVISGKYTRNQLKEVLDKHYIETKSSHSADAHYDLQHVISSYNEEHSKYHFTSEEIVQKYHSFSGLLFEQLDIMIANGSKTAETIMIEDMPLSLLAIFLMEDMNKAGAYREVYELGQYISGHFEFGDAVERIDFYLEYAKAMNGLHMYRECDAVLDRLEENEKHFAGQLVNDRFDILENRPEKNAHAAAAELAKKAMNENDFRSNSYNYGIFAKFAAFFRKNGDEANAEKAGQIAKSLRIAGIPKNRKDPELENLWLGLTVFTDKLMIAGRPEEIKKAEEYLKNLGYNRHEISILLTWMAGGDLLLYQSEPTQGLDKIKSDIQAIYNYSKEELDLALEKLNISIVHKLSGLLSFEMYGNMTNAAIGVGCLSMYEDILYQWIDHALKDLNTNRYIVFTKMLQQDDIDFSLFLRNCLFVFGVSNEPEPMLRFSKHMLDVFDFTSDDTHITVSLKAGYAEALFLLHRQEECLSFIAQWQEEEVEKPDSLWLELIKGCISKDVEKAVKAADEAMKTESGMTLKELYGLMRMAYIQAMDADKLIQLNQKMYNKPIV